MAVPSPVTSEASIPSAAASSVPVSAMTPPSRAHHSAPVRIASSAPITTTTSPTRWNVPVPVVLGRIPPPSVMLGRFFIPSAGHVVAESAAGPSSASRVKVAAAATSSGAVRIHPAAASSAVTRTRGQVPAGHERIPVLEHPPTSGTEKRLPAAAGPDASVRGRERSSAEVTGRQEVVGVAGGHKVRPVERRRTGSLRRHVVIGQGPETVQQAGRVLIVPQKAVVRRAVGRAAARPAGRRRRAVV